MTGQRFLRRTYVPPLPLHKHMKTERKNPGNPTVHTPIPRPPPPRNRPTLPLPIPPDPRNTNTKPRIERQITIHRLRRESSVACGAREEFGGDTGGYKGDEEGVEEWTGVVGGWCGGDGSRCRSGDRRCECCDAWWDVREGWKR